MIGWFFYYYFLFCFILHLWGVSLPSTCCFCIICFYTVDTRFILCFLTDCATALNPFHLFPSYFFFLSLSLCSSHDKRSPSAAAVVTTTGCRPPAAPTNQKYVSRSISSAGNPPAADSPVWTSHVTNKTKQSFDFRHPAYTSSIESPTFHRFVSETLHK